MRDSYHYLCELLHNPNVESRWVKSQNLGMENNTRLLTKACTWQLIGFVVMSLINYWVMGDWRQGLGLSGLLTFVGLVTYYLHERVWSRIQWGRMQGRVDVK